MTNSTKYPDIVVDLSRVSGNSFSILGAVTRAMKENGVPLTAIDKFRTEAMSGTYNHLLFTVTKWITVEGFGDCDDGDEFDADDDEDEEDLD